MNNWWKYLIGVLIVVVLIGLGVMSKVIVNYPKIVDCRQQFVEVGFPQGIVDSPAKLIGMKEITTIGCAYDFKRDDQRADLIRFNVVVFDSMRIPYVYEMRIDERLSVCRREVEETKCGKESVADYNDFPEETIVTVGIVNSLIPNKQADGQPDLEYLSRLETALERGSWYPLQLINKRIQVWSLAY